MQAVKQVFQNVKNGQTEVWELPFPNVTQGWVRILSSVSLISVGTEKMLMEFGKGSWIQKARSQPQKVKEVWQKIQTDGFLPTAQIVKAKLEQPIPLGYSNVGVVEALGAGLESSDLKVGDRVLSNGPHAEVVTVPQKFMRPHSR